MVSGIPNIINSLSEDLKARVELVVQLTENLEDTQAKLELAKRDLRRVQVALEALSGNSIPLPEDTEDKPSIALPIEPRATPKEHLKAAYSAGGGSEESDSRPICNSCGSGRMNYTSRTLNNGKKVTLWLCSECRNERF